MCQTEQIPDGDCLNRWAYDPAVSEPTPTKGLKFQSAVPHDGCESFNWNKYLSDAIAINKKGAEKKRDSQIYLGYYIADVKNVRSVHIGKSYEASVWFEVSHTPTNENRAHTDIKIIKQANANKGFIQRAKIDLAEQAMSDLYPV